MTKPMHDIKSNFDKIFQTIKSLNLSVPDQNGNIPKPERVPLFADLGVLSLVLTAEYMSLDSENWLFKKIDSAYKADFPQSVTGQERLIALKGIRGAGRTTLLLQHAILHLPKDRPTLYVAMDDLFFLENNLSRSWRSNFIKMVGKTCCLMKCINIPISLARSSSFMTNCLG